MKTKPIRGSFTYRKKRMRIGAPLRAMAKQTEAMIRHNRDEIDRITGRIREAIEALPKGSLH